MVMDFCPGGDLSSMIEIRMRLSLNLIKIYVCEILLALEALHDSFIIFRDLKSSNIVIDGDGHALLTDFGLSKEGVKAQTRTKSICGSLAYLAPEMIK
jgi:serine/threonine protein kinase